MILVVDMNCKKDSLGFYEFVLPIVEVIKPLSGWTIKHYLDVTSKDLAESDAVILSGTPLKDTATLRQPERFQWLKDTDKPVLGICAGMETIGVVYGLHLRGSLEIGMTEVKVVKKNPLFADDFKAYSLHSLCVEPSEDFDVWAKSKWCTQVIKHKRKSVYGILFHPEVRNQEILANWVRQFKKREQARNC